MLLHVDQNGNHILYNFNKLRCAECNVNEMNIYIHYI